MLVNPDVKIPNKASDIHGITDEAVIDAPRFKAAAVEVCKLARFIFADPAFPSSSILRSWKPSIAAAQCSGRLRIRLMCRNSLKRFARRSRIGVLKP